MSLSVGAATDYVYAKAQLAVAGVTVNGKPAVAFDGAPDELAPGMFLVGLGSPPPDIEGDTTLERAWEGLGAEHIVDRFSIPCCIDIRVSGTVQKTARDIAEGILNTFWTSIAADLTLGGVLQAGRVAQIDLVTFTPRSVGTVTEPGRRQFVTFSVLCENLTT